MNSSPGKWQKSSPELIAFFQSIIPKDPSIEPRKMFGYPCAFVNGHLFTGLHEENMILRLDEKDRDEFCQTYQAGSFEPIAGRRMREYVVIPPALFKKPALVKKWIFRSLEYVGSLPPKVKKIRK